MDHIFYLKLENDVYSAKVTEIEHPYHQMYHVQFDDGYENIFFTDVETGCWMEEDLGETMLATHFGMKVFLLNGSSAHPVKQLAWCKASVAGKIINFGFYTFRQGEETFFEVYASNHKFLYLFRNNGNGWKVYNAQYLIRNSQYTNQIKIITSILNGLSGYL